MSRLAPRTGDVENDRLKRKDEETWDSSEVLCAKMLGRVDSVCDARARGATDVGLADLC